MPISRTRLIVSWVISGLIGLLMLGPSALGKFLEYEGKAENFQKLGFTTEIMTKIGVVEVIVAILYLFPRTSFLGAILVTGYLGGATVTHLRVGDPWFMPVVLGVLAWVSLGLRRPEIFQMAFGRSVTTGESK